MNGPGMNRETGPILRRIGLRNLVAGVLFCVGMAGCSGTMAEYIPDFKLRNYINPPDPILTIRNSTSGDERRDALLRLTEPRANGGSQQQQDLVMSILEYSALHDSQAVCRLAAIDTLRRFRDPRTVNILKDAYYRAGSFNPETATILRCQALEALGQTRNPAAVETLVKVLREPPVEGSDHDKQQKNDERMAAARALGNFSHYQATAALVEVLREEKDISLRRGAHQALVQSTGRNLPEDAQAWKDLLDPSSQQNRALAQEPSLKDRFLRWTGWSQNSQPISPAQFRQPAQR